MTTPIHHMTITRYYRDGRPWDTERVDEPSWSEVEAAVRRMDDFCFPVVALNTTPDDSDENIFNVLGGNGRWALFQMMADWVYEDPAGSDEETRLWESDQGYFCREKNVITDVEKVLRITKAYYVSGSYDGLDAVS